MWVARDKNGELRIWTIRPSKDENAGEWSLSIVNQCSAYINGLQYREVKWEDKEPRELILKPIKEELGFVNLYKDGGQVKVGWKIFPTKKEAEENFKDDEKYITTANIQWRNSHDNL